MLTQKEENEIMEALKQWAANAPDQPMLGFLQREALMTPREILGEVQKRTEDGISLFEIFEHAVRREGMDAVTSRLRRAQHRGEYNSNGIER